VCTSPRVTKKQNPIKKAHKFASIPTTQFLLLVKQTNRTEKQEHLGAREEIAALLYVLLLVAHMSSKWREVE